MRALLLGVVLVGCSYTGRVRIESKEIPRTIVRATPTQAAVTLPDGRTIPLDTPKLKVARERRAGKLGAKAGASALGTIGFLGCPVAGVDVYVSAYGCGAIGAGAGVLVGAPIGAAFTHWDTLDPSTSDVILVRCRVLREAAPARARR